RDRVGDATKPLDVLEREDAIARLRPCRGDQTLALPRSQYRRGDPQDLRDLTDVDAVGPHGRRLYLLAAQPRPPLPSLRREHSRASGRDRRTGPPPLTLPV